MLTRARFDVWRYLDLLKHLADIAVRIHDAAIEQDLVICPCQAGRMAQALDYARAGFDRAHEEASVWAKKKAARKAAF
ncbi:hypothetical protein BTH42_18600 [Burkholderia sp. SRS-W-2-2016]|nr:hypothetical protein BTH42_18600 [Burkholderia sp. SRS-W-2-2016]